MAKIHVLGRAGLNVYTVVIHATTPAGNNSAGISWATAIANSGHNTTILPVGNGAGQISQNEANQVAAGSIIEAILQWGDDPTWTNQQRIDDLDLRATQLVAETVARYQDELKYFGFTRT